MPILFLLFIIVPLIEMVILIKVGGVIGAFPTVGLVCLTAIIGVTLIRLQGASTFLQAQQAMARGEVPAQAMVDAICLAVGGAMLLTPGFVTDGFGFLLLVPPLRRWLLQNVLRHALARAQVRGAGFSGQNPSRKHKGDRTIEGEYRRED